MLELQRHLFHFDAKPGKHPCVLCLFERTDAPAAFLRVVACCVEKMIAQHAKEDAPCEIYMKRLNVEWVAVY